jgi:hypothetical protein
MIKFVHKGSFKNTEAFLERNKKMDIYKTLQKYGEQGVAALSANTPKDTGVTADSWSYEIVETAKGFKIYYRNSNLNEGIPIAIIIQYGHGTGTGGYVEGRDYINPALQPVFTNLADEAWEEVTK